MKEDEGVSNSIEEEGDKQWSIPEQPMSCSGVGAPFTLLKGDHSSADQDDGHDQGEAPAYQMEVIHGDLGFLFRGDKDVEGNAWGPEEGGNKEEVDACPEYLADISTVPYIVVVMKEDKDLRDGNAETASKVCKGEEEDQLVQGLLLVGKEDEVDNDGYGPKQW